jgi:hypothetical protein
MKPFLLHFKSNAHEMIVPTLAFDEKLSLNIVCDSGAPLASTSYLLATATKTEAEPESDDADADYSFDAKSDYTTRTTLLATVTKTAAKQESDDAD